MKLKYSLFSRRKFLNALLAGGILAFFTPILFPVARFFFPSEKESDRVILNYSDVENLGPYSTRTFICGNKPVILIRKTDNYKAFASVCTHLSCSVSFFLKKENSIVPAMMACLMRSV